MSATSVKQFVLIGLPASGKTSFLAALWYLVQHSQTARVLELERLDGDSKYLNQISRAWAAYQPVPHTSVDSETVVSMLLRNTKTNHSMKLAFPDLSGESFTLQWTTRQFTKGYNAFLENASGAILFLNPEHIHKPIRIDMATPLVEEIIGSGVPEVVEDTSQPITPWNPEQSPTQVQVVELLQFIAARNELTSPFRLSVMVSAWDKLRALEMSPEDWLNRELPLLHQFLASNQKLFETAIYGISAQGGDYSHRAALEELVPSDRIEVVGVNIENNHDLTEPLQWLMR